jgi:hypothetical protein
MLNFIVNLFKADLIIVPSTDTERLKEQSKSIVSSLSRGNILLQQKKYTTREELIQKKEHLSDYFSKNL